MEKPVIIAVDDDPAMVGAVARDLRLAYGEHYQIVRADSGDVAARSCARQRQKYEGDHAMVGCSRWCWMEVGRTGVEERLS